jgi:hypothetical protein
MTNVLDKLGVFRPDRDRERVKGGHAINNELEDP